jgi:hypothetical protein
LTKLKDTPGDSDGVNNDAIVKRSVTIYNRTCPANCPDPCATLYKLIADQPDLGKACRNN